MWTPPQPDSCDDFNSTLAENPERSTQGLVIPPPQHGVARIIRTACKRVAIHRRRHGETYTAAAAIVAAPTIAASPIMDVAVVHVAPVAVEVISLPWCPHSRSLYLPLLIFSLW